MGTPETQQKSSSAFLVQAAISFGISFIATTAGIVNLPLDMWQRGFLLISELFLVSSVFTLAKVVRDQHEATRVRYRVDEARLEKLLAEHDPFKA